MSQVLFGGSRSLPLSASPLVAQVVRACGLSVSVGCATGADAAVIAAALSAGSLLSVFAVGSAQGAGFWSGSAPVGLLRSAAAAGAVVRWLAGGGLHVPLRARLIRRSLAALAGASAAVFFLARPSSPGSLRVAAAAAAAQLPVFAFAVGFSGAPTPLSGVAGAWRPGSVFGLPCWSWCPAATQPALF